MAPRTWEACYWRYWGRSKGIYRCVDSRPAKYTTWNNIPIECVSLCLQREGVFDCSSRILRLGHPIHIHLPSLCLHKNCNILPQNRNTFVCTVVERKLLLLEEAIQS